MPDKETLRRVASTFHKNFSAGRFDDNGPLVTEDISVDSNTFRFTGREKFIERIRRYEGPFPGLKMSDRLMIVDGNKAGVHYLPQGVHRGQFGDIAATGRKIEVRSAEIFTFNDRAQMADLITVTELDRLKAQVAGQETVAEHADITLAENGSASEAEIAKQRDIARQLYDSFSRGDHDAAASLVAEDIVVQPGSGQIEGRAGFIDYSTRHNSAFPDMASEFEDILVDGKRACVSFHRRGTHHGDFTLVDGTVIAATGREFSFRTVEFLRFNDRGLIDELISVSNSEDLVSQLTGA